MKSAAMASGAGRLLDHARLHEGVPEAIDEFRAYAAEHSIVPVWTELLGDLETPVAAFAKLVGEEPGFLLESVEGPMADGARLLARRVVQRQRDDSGAAAE